MSNQGTNLSENVKVVLWDNDSQAVGGRKLEAGENVTLDLSEDGKVIVNAAGGGSAGSRVVTPITLNGSIDLEIPNDSDSVFLLDTTPLGSIPYVDVRIGTAPSQGNGRNVTILLANGLAPVRLVLFQPVFGISEYFINTVGSSKTFTCVGDVGYFIVG